MGMMGSDYRTRLVIIGSFMIAAGGSIGSLPVTVEVFRKRRNGGITWVDWATLVFSGIASLVETVTSLSFLGGFEIAQSMPRIMLLAILGTLDTCLGMAELGDYLGSYDQRLGQWKKEYRRAVKEYYNNQQPQQYAVPTGDYAYTPPLPQQELGTPESNGNGGHCWCGEYCKNPQHYSAHVRHDHYDEVLRGYDSESARNAMLEQYGNHS
jgi:hypothetical protein